MKNLQKINSSQQNKYDEIIEYLKQDNGYWLKNDIWNIDDNVFEKEEYKTGVNNIKFNYIENETLKNEIKFYLVYSIKNKYLSTSTDFVL